MVGIGRAFGFLTKSELFRVPAFGPAMLRLGCISVDRKNRQKAHDALGLAAERLRTGSSIVAFPEGTRSEHGLVRAFKKGPFYLAQAAGVPVVPVGIVGTDRVLSKRSIMVRPARVELHVGEPIHCEGDSAASRDELRAQVREKILSMTGLRGA
jgi:1-acyl-sn-glycerol-3-phosphate acyltransferase